MQGRGKKTDRESIEVGAPQRRFQTDPLPHSLTSPLHLVPEVEKKKTTCFLSSLAGQTRVSPLQRHIRNPIKTLETRGAKGQEKRKKKIYEYPETNGLIQREPKLSPPKKSKTSSTVDNTLDILEEMDGSKKVGSFSSV